MARVRTDEARNTFGTVLNRVAFGKERIVLERRGKALAAIVPLEDLARLEGPATPAAAADPAAPPPPPKPGKKDKSRKAGKAKKAGKR